MIIEWGTDAVSFHTADGPTHSTWFSAKSIAGLERALEEVQKGMSNEAARNKRSSKEREAIGRAFEEITEAGSHRDDMFRILHYSSK